jgi:CPA2 family monovalent cation:H+ antiporter-2
MLGPDVSGGVGEVLGALLRSFVVIAFVLGATRWFVPRALDKVAENSTDEVFLLSVAAFALAIAYAASLLGLTDSLGAFIAGLVISSSRHRERALRYITPFQMLFSAIFFASIGMLLDIGFVVDRWQLVLVLAVGTVVFKVIATSSAAKVFHRPGPVIATSALLLAQVGEFAFVLEQNGRAAGLTPAGVGEQGSQAFIATAVLLFILTPLLDAGGRLAGARLERRAVSRGLAPAAPPVPAVVVVGGDHGARALLAAAVEQAGLDNPVIACGADRQHGDPVEPDSAALIVAMDLDPPALEALLDLRGSGPDVVPVLAWVRDPDEADRAAGRDGVWAIDAMGAAGLTVARAMLDALGVEQDRRITALTSAVESLPAELRRPLA